MGGGVNPWFYLLAAGILSKPGDRRVKGPTVRLELIPVGKLRPHEATHPLLLHETINAIRRSGSLWRPILVEGRYYIILDGHHRYAALRALGYRMVPAYIVDYFDPLIELTLWPGAIVDRIEKQEVIDLVMKKKLLFPPKTTRHVVRFALEDHPVALEELL